MNPDFLDVLRELSKANARFLIVGAFAVSVHAEPRATGDIDIWVEATPDNAAKTYAALVSFGAPLQDLAVSELSTPGIVFQMGLPPNRIDILTQVSGLTFDEAWADRKEIDLFGQHVAVLGKNTLIKNKLAAGRPKDLADVDALRRIS